MKFDTKVAKSKWINNAEKRLMSLILSENSMI